MRYLVWGTGTYCKEKIKYIKLDNIIAFVERKKIVFQENETILPEEIVNYQFDKIIVMSNHYLEIIPELILRWNIEPEKIIPGIACRPYLSKELELMSNNTEIKVNLDGTLFYTYCGNKSFVISKDEDWIQVRDTLCCEKTDYIIRNLSLAPVG